ncbi:hypothetical protein RJ639_011241 [Escallonia herrerae]|uniref:Uncharacterized protein n=1 Tax=Escallonia herrerae TaxID=1293975 RepID=A0AA89APT5_9ASTE|nr:hypothetical protein RJ639_011241 [Escallonia herrerae]
MGHFGLNPTARASLRPQPRLSLAGVASSGGLYAPSPNSGREEWAERKQGHVASITSHANTAHSRIATVASYFFANAANYASDFAKANIATFAKRPSSVSAKSNTANHARHPNHNSFDSKHSDYSAQDSILRSTSVNHQPMRCQRFQESVRDAGCGAMAELAQPEAYALRTIQL